MNQIIQHISKLSKNDLVLVGGKAANLGKLIKHGFQVPEGLVITTNVYDLFITNNDLENIIQDELNSIDYSDLKSIETVAINIQTAIRKASLPSQIIQWINTDEDLHRLSPIAIRSSATAEDLPTASFAGQQETYLNIREKSQILHYIKECYASLWSTRTIVYRYQHKIPHENVKLAIILQTMISASSAGVIFTRSPISLADNEILIESTYGLGESLVSGQISPDQFIVRRQDPSPNKKKLEILSREISQKEFKIKSGEIGIENVPLSLEEQNNPSISDKQVMDLANISIQIEKTFNSPQDIEWVYDDMDNLYITQSRPITTIQLAPKDADSVFWTRGYADDYWNDTTSPLFFDLLGTQLTLIVNTELNSLMGYPKISNKLLHLHHGHVYFNLETLKRKVEYEIPPFIRTDDVLNYFPEGMGFYGKNTVRNMPFRLGKRIISEIRIMLHDNSNGSILHTANSYEQWTEKVFWPFCEKFDSILHEYGKNGEVYSIMELGDALEQQMVKHFRMVRYGIPVHNIGMNLLANYLLTRFIGNDLAPGLYPILISGLWHKTAETNEEVQNLAAKIHLTPKLLTLVRETESSDISSKLMDETSNLNVQKFLQDIQKFFADFGDRGFSREICYPRWREAPSYVFDQLKALVSDQKVDVNLLKERNLERLLKVENFVAFRIRSTRFGFLKFKFFNAVLNLARRYIIFRENQRFNLDKWITRNRNLYLEIGKTLKARGYLNNENDVFFLHKHEIRKIVSTSYSHSSQDTLKLVHSRKEDFRKYEFSIPPKFLFGSREFDDPMPKSYDNSAFRGIPASHGIVTAKIRILMDIKQVSTVRAGEILVVQKTDPGWTPVFAKIGGLITETGGILSHGAVVSREYGIPSVTNVYNACNIFRTGMTVKIDGTKGIVTILTNQSSEELQRVILTGDLQMDSDANIVIIGAGSASFGLDNLSGIIAHEDLQNTTLKLVDIQENSLKAISALGEVMKREWDSKIEITSFLDRKQALIDADFVILSVAVDREETWLKDYQIAEKYGYYHYAENGLMGSFGHTARGLAFIMPILNDIHDLAPDSTLINFTNPVPRIGYAAEHAGVKSIGLCHQIWHGYGILGRYLASDLGITENLDLEVKWTDESQQQFSEFVVEAAGEFDIKAAGLNHFAWMLDVRRLETNEDVYPLVRQESQNVHPNFEPLTKHMFDIFGLLPIVGDCHLIEYLPYTFSKENWEKYRIQLYDFERGQIHRDSMWTRINEIITGKRQLDIQPNPTERADAIIGELLTNSNAYEQSVNILNKGAITNLPDDAIVEVPALVNSYGVSGMKIGRLPEAIAALCQREISIAKLITRSSIMGDREAALQAFALMIPDLSLAEKMLDDYLAIHKTYLPQFA